MALQSTIVVLPVKALNIVAVPATNFATGYVGYVPPSMFVKTGGVFVPVHKAT